MNPQLNPNFIHEKQLTRESEDDYAEVSQLLARKDSNHEPWLLKLNATMHLYTSSLMESVMT